MANDININSLGSQFTWAKTVFVDRFNGIGIYKKEKKLTEWLN